ncbi:secreted protein [Melampsora americana]|nr:secreted protein [Melampsora americana]
MHLLFLYLIAYGIFETQCQYASTHISDSRVEFPFKDIPDVPKNFYPETLRLCAKQLGWPEHLEVEAPAFLDKKSLQDERIAKCIPNDFPYQTPAGVDDLVVWIRLPLVNKESFKPGKGESWPSEEYNDPQRVSALLEYVDRHYFHGYAGPRDVDNDKNLNIGQLLHPGKKPYEASNGQMITQREGREAFKWAARHLNAYLEETLLNKYEEVAWIKGPNHRIVLGNAKAISSVTS